MKCSFQEREVSLRDVKCDDMLFIKKHIITFWNCVAIICFYKLAPKNALNGVKTKKNLIIFCFCGKISKKCLLFVLKSANISFAVAPLVFFQEQVYCANCAFVIKEVQQMAKCEYCGKGVSFGIKVSHSHRRSNRTWKPNVQRVKAVVNGSPKRVYACTRCLRSGKVTRAV